MKPITQPWRAKRYVEALRLLILVACAWPLPSQAQADFSADTVKAAFLYRFTNYIEWPASAADQASFIIAVRCGDGVATELERIVAGRTIKGRPAQVRRLKSLQELDGAQVLYIGPECYPDLQSRLVALVDKPVLVVTDEDSGGEDAGTINFLAVDHHIRFVVSLSAARLSHLKISSELLSVAVRVLSELRWHSRCGSWHPDDWAPLSCPMTVVLR